MDSLFGEEKDKNEKKDKYPKDQLLVSHTSDLQFMFDTVGCGSKENVEFYRPKIPKGFSFLGDFVQKAGKKEPKTIIIAKDPTVESILCEPSDYRLLWDSTTVKGTLKSNFCVWEPIPPTDYVAMGCVVFAGKNKPPTKDFVKCIKKTSVEVQDEINLWDDDGATQKGLTIYVNTDNKKDAYKTGLFKGNDKKEKLEHYTILKTGAFRVNIPSQIEHYTRLSDNFKQLIETDDFSDTKITVEGKTLYAHSIFLKGRCNWEKEVTIDKKYDYKTVRLILEYLYLGKCDVNLKNVYQVLSCADKYGISTLRNGCFDFLMWSVDQNSVCQLMMKGKRKEFEFDATVLIEKCINFIENQAFDVVKSEDFLNLDQDLVISIYKNDKIVCEEIELFQNAIRWAKNQKGDLKELLEPILCHIRFPLMDPKDLLRVVKPTGLIDKKLYMEALEFASLPHLFTNNKGLQFKERFRIFHGSSVLDSLQSMQINEWIGCKKTQEWKLLYKGTKDGFQGSTFHQKVDNHKDTVTVIQSSNGNIFGAYSPCTWSSNGSYQYDAKSFIFSLTNSLKKPFKVLHSGSNLNSIYCAGGYGPTFGSGHDIYICNNSNTTSGSYSNFGYSFPVTHLPGYQYGSNQVKNILAGGYNFMTKEIEVYEMKK